MTQQILWHYIDVSRLLIWKNEIINTDKLVISSLKIKYIVLLIIFDSLRILIDHLSIKSKHLLFILDHAVFYLLIVNKQIKEIMFLNLKISVPRYFIKICKNQKNSLKMNSLFFKLHVTLKKKERKKEKNSYRVAAWIAIWLCGT
jgi:hypothetical protein